MLAGQIIKNQFLQKKTRKKLN